MEQDNQVNIHYWIYGAGVTILAGIVAFISLYPASHFVAFMVLAAFVSLIAMYHLYTTGFSPSEIVVSIIPIFGIALIGSYFVGPNLPEETENHGWLIPANLPVPTTNCFPGGPGLMFIAGHNIAKFDDQAINATLLTLDSTRVISVEKKDNQLSFDVDLFDADGNIAVKIIRNEFHLMPNSKISYQERSSDRSEITVHDNKDKEVLYIKYANATTVIIRGVFYSAEGRLAVIDNNSIVLGGNLGLSGNCSRDIAFTLNTSGFGISPFLPAHRGN